MHGEFCTEIYWNCATIWFVNAANDGEILHTLVNSLWFYDRFFPLLHLELRYRAFSVSISAIANSCKNPILMKKSSSEELARAALLLGKTFTPCRDFYKHGQLFLFCVLLWKDSLVFPTTFRRTKGVRKRLLFATPRGVHKRPPLLSIQFCFGHSFYLLHFIGVHLSLFARN